MLILTDYSQFHGMGLFLSNFVVDDTFVLSLVFGQRLLDQQPLAAGAVVSGDPASGLATSFLAVFVPGWITEGAVEVISCSKIDFDCGVWGLISIRVVRIPNKNDDNFFFSRIIAKIKNT